MCRIAEVLITLQQVGNVKYIGWILQVPCTSRPEIIQSLQDQAKCMEDELCEWKRTVKHARQDFYELNYYTTLQLLSLRKELGNVRLADRAASISPSVLALLESITPQVTSSALCDMMQYVSSTSQMNDLDDQSTECSQVVAPTSVSEEIMASVNLDASEHIEESLNDNPHLSEDDINDEQKAIMAYVTTRLMCSKVLVLKAFEMCYDESMDKYDYERWCNDNMDKFKFEEGGSDEDSESDEESSSSESESNVPFTCSPGNIMNVTLAKY